MYFKDFPQFLYDFNYGDKVKTRVVLDITRNVRFKSELLENITLYDEYDIVDGETPEIISEKFYGTPEYHWVVMLANGKYDYRSDFPLIEPVLQKHIADVYNPTLYSEDWFWGPRSDGEIYFHIRITSVQVPFDAAYLTAPVKVTIKDDDSSFIQTINFPTDFLGLDSDTQYFYFPVPNHNTNEWLIEHGTSGSTVESGVGNVQLTINTEGRENNPVYYLNNLGVRVNPSETAIPVTGDVVHRLENDQKRRIKIISPSLLETIIRNFEDEL
jgi:hypothetical protein